MKLLKSQAQQQVNQGQTSQQSGQRINPAVAMQALLLLLISLLIFSTGVNSGTTSSGEIFKTGYVGARAIVLGPVGQQPIYAAYDEYGVIQDVIGEAVNDYANTQVMSGDSYRSYFKRLAQLQSEYPNSVFSSDGKRLLSAEGALLLTAEIRLDQVANPLIMDETSATKILSLIYNELGEVKYSSPYRIAFRTSMYQLSDGSDAGPGNDGALLRQSGDILRGPMEGAVVQYSYSDAWRAGVSSNGFYAIQAQIPPCPGFVYTHHANMHMELKYTNFNPRDDKEVTSWHFLLPTSDTCANFTAVGDPVAHSLFFSSVADVQYHYNFFVDLLMINSKGNYLLGLDRQKIPLAATTEYALNPIQYTRLDHTANLDLDGNGITDQQVAILDSQGKVSQLAVYLNGRPVERDPLTNEPINYDLLRQPDYEATQANSQGTETDPAQMHQGLLTQISKADLLDTDIITYRESNGEILAERSKLDREGNETSHGLSSNGGSFSAGINETNSTIYYNTPIVWTEFRIDNGLKMGTFSSKTQREYSDNIGNSSTEPDALKDLLRPGEKLKTYMINRATGYIGISAPYEVQSNDKTLGSPAPALNMGPPNLKIKVERKHQVQAGITQGEERSSLVGFEGSGLSSDTLIVITTEWYAHDGSPLPDSLPGYTARLAKVVENKQLNEVGTVAQDESNNTPSTSTDTLDQYETNGSIVSRFEIQPGTHTKAIYIPEDDTPEHFYIHVSGQDLTEVADFTPKGTAGILGERPAKYVPFKVAVYDEATTLAKRKAARLAGEDVSEVKSVYNWVYRPEMQFSVYDLQRQQLQLTDNLGDVQLIDLTNAGENVLGLLLNDDLSYVDLLYDLTESQFDPLARFSGDRELIFSIGAEEALATITPGGVVRFNDPAHISLLDDADLLTIRLYQNNDAANVLWEFTLGNGLDVISSSDPDSAAAKSFIICDSTDINICQLQQPITVKIVGDFADDAQVQWTIEALEYVAPANQDTPVDSVNDKFAYGKPKDIRVGRNLTNVSAVGTGTGKTGDAWVSFAQNFNDVRAISFLPDLSEVAAKHYPVTYNSPDDCTGQYATCRSGTNMSDIPRHNPHVSYKIIAKVNNETFEAIVKMDDIDVLRQEYINHKAGNADITYSVPDRSEFALVSSNSNYQDLVEGPCNGAPNCADYPYEYILDRTALSMWQAYKTSFDSIKNNVFMGVGSTGISITGDWSVKLNSTYRNPERNERVGSSGNSKHQLGGAFDMGIDGFDSSVPSAEADYLSKAKKAYVAWKILTENRPLGATMIQMEPSPAKPLIRVSSAVIAPATKSWEPRYLNTGNEKTETYMTTEDVEPIGGDGIPDGFKYLNHFHIQDDTI